MKKTWNSLFGIVLGSILLLMTSGCYKRTVTPSYQSDASEVTRIREHLGAKTPEKEFIKEEEEESDE